VPHLKKGSRVLAEGALEHRSYKAEEGTTRYVTEVVLRPFHGSIGMLDPRRPDAEPRSQRPEREPAGRR
jgi:single-strand DNA-binding protein